MADQSLRRARACATIPAGYVNRFRREVVFLLGAAAEQIDEAAQWYREGRAPNGETRPRTPSTDELALLDAAREMFELLPADDATDPSDLNLVEVDRRVLVSAAEGCSLEVADEFHSEAQRIDGDTARLIEEFNWWRSLRNQLTLVEVA